jgi:very-short-patch-repair endonuclease
MSDPTAILAGMARRSHSVNVPLADIRTTGDLLASGLSERQIRTRVAHGELVRLADGVYVSGTALDRIKALPDGRFIFEAAGALMTVAPGAVLSHQAAARLHQLDILTRRAAIEVTHVPGKGLKCGKPGVTVYSAQLPAAHVGWSGGIPVTTPARTVIDLARGGTFAEGVVVADCALRLKQTTKKELAAVLADMPRWPGTVRARQVIEFADARAESPLESIARISFRSQRLPTPELQVVISGDQGDFIARVDFLWPRYRTIAEVDGQFKYEDPRRARAQLRRDKQLRAAGYEVVHFDWRDITTQPAAAAAAIRQAFQRSQRLSAHSARSASSASSAQSARPAS